MHEEALLRDLLGKTLEVAARSGEGRVTRLHVWVGALAHVDGRQFAERFRELARGSAAADAIISLELSSDPTDPRAQGIVLREVTLEGPGAPLSPAAPTIGGAP